MSYEQSYQECFQAFIDRDYDRCALQILPMLNSGVHIQLLQVFLISLQRMSQQLLSQRDEFEEAGPRSLARTEQHPWLINLPGPNVSAPDLILGMTERDPWSNNLVKLTLGQAELPQVLAQAEDDRPRCQAHYYSGARLLTFGEAEAAQAEFEACLAGPEQCCPEWTLAWADLAFSLNELGSLLHAQGEYGQALPCLKQALAMFEWLYAEDRYPQGHRHLAGSLNNLGASLWGKGEHGEGLAYLARALGMYERLYPADHCPQGHPDFAASLSNRGRLLADQDEHGKALPYYERALAMFERLFPEDRYPQGHRDLARSLNDLGELLRDRGEYDKALPYSERAVAMCERLYPENRYPRGHPHLADTLATLGGLFRDHGEYGKALPYLERALAIRERLYPQGHADLAESLNRLGWLFRLQGEYGTALPYLERALAMRERLYPQDRHPQGHSDLANSLNGLGMLFRAQGEYGKALPYYEGALAMRERLYPEDRYPQGHAHLAMSLDNLGELLHGQGEYGKALPYLERALAMCEQLYPQDRYADGHPDLATILYNQGRLLLEQGESGKALPYLERALAMFERLYSQDRYPRGHPDLGRSLNSLGLMLLEEGQCGMALPYLERALAMRERLYPEDRYPPGHPDLAFSLVSLGGLLLEQGEYGKALPYLERALAMRERLYPQDRYPQGHPQLANSLDNLSVLLRDQGEYGKALAYQERSLAISRKILGENHPQVARAFKSLGRLWAASDHPEKALQLMAQAAGIGDRVIGQVFSISSESRRMAFLTTVRADLESFLSLVYQHFPDSPEAVRAALELSLRRKALGAEALRAQRDAVLGGRYPHLKGQLQQLTELCRQIAVQQFSQPEPEASPVEYRRRLGRLNAERERREEELARQIPEMNLDEQLRTADARKVACKLPGGVALVEFVRFNVFNFRAVPARGEPPWGPARYLAFVILAPEVEHREKIDSGEEEPIVQMIPLGEAELIDQRVDKFRRIIGCHPSRRARGPMSPVHDPKPSVSACALPDGTDLRKAVFDPLKAALAGRTRLLLAPDGELTCLPFEVLPAGEDGSRLIDHYQISYVAAGRDVLRFRAETEAKGTQPLVAADPDFDLAAEQPPTPVSTIPPVAAAGAGIPTWRYSRDLDRGVLCGPLPGTRAEGERIADLLKVRPWLGGAVVKARLRQVRSPRILHLATHGQFLPNQQVNPNETADLLRLGFHDRLQGVCLESPLLRSWLVLAGYNTWRTGRNPPPEAENGILTAEDVTGLDLLATELVVLSACETGLGQVHVGEGVFGLRRAFVQAGAGTLVMCLWSVPDLATGVLMERFYENLLRRRMGRADALREAQFTTREVTVGLLRRDWLSDDGIDRLAAGDEKRRRYLQRLAQQPDGHRPFEDPHYWGAFICQGAPFPLSGTVPPTEEAARPASSSISPCPKT
jgi:tetratricopeptide (TPR) repeat protein/CHAT domain-containing protein